MTDTQRLSLPLLAAGQAQKHVTMNDALDRLDKLVHLRVVSRSLTVPPVPPVDGGHYIPATGASGAWAGLSGLLVVLEGATWRSSPPAAGMIASIADEQILLVHDGADWRPAKGLLDEARIARLGLGTAPHATAALLMASDRAIFSSPVAPATGSDVQVVVNKALATATGSLLFQTAWQGRGEFGLCGNDKLSLKVSANGTTWATALVADNASGDMTLPGRLTIGSGAPLASGLTISRPSPAIVLKDTQGLGNAHVSITSLVDANGDEKVWMGLGSSSNTEFTFLSQYADGITFYAYGGNNPIRFLQNGVTRLRVHTNGFVGVNMATPTAPLHVGGAARVGSFAKAALPSAATSGDGSIVFVSDDAASATLAFSDGTIWRRVHDRQAVA